MGAFFKMAVSAASLALGVDGAAAIVSHAGAASWTVPVSVFGGAAIGAGVSLLFGDPVRTRRALWAQIVGAWILGGAGSVLLAEGTGWTWAINHPAYFALVAAAVVRWFLPVTIERGKQIIKEYRLTLSRNKGDDR
jgi:hypothetical protein